MAYDLFHNRRVYCRKVESRELPRNSKPIDAQAVTQRRVLWSPLSQNLRDPTSKIRDPRSEIRDPRSEMSFMPPSFTNRSAIQDPRSKIKFMVPSFTKSIRDPRSEIRDPTSPIQDKVLWSPFSLKAKMTRLCPV